MATRRSRNSLNIYFGIVIGHSAFGIGDAALDQNIPLRPVHLHVPGADRGEIRAPLEPHVAADQDDPFSVEDPENAPEGKTFLDCLNPHSLEVLSGAQAEPSLAGAVPGTRVQFERLGYFCVDPDSTADALVFNRTVSLRDTWARISQKGG